MFTRAVGLSLRRLIHSSPHKSPSCGICLAPDMNFFDLYSRQQPFIKSSSSSFRDHFSPSPVICQWVGEHRNEFENKGRAVHKPADVFRPFFFRAVGAVSFQQLNRDGDVPPFVSPTIPLFLAVKQSWTSGVKGTSLRAPLRCITRDGTENGFDWLTRFCGVVCQDVATPPRIDLRARVDWNFFFLNFKFFKQWSIVI